MFACRRRLLAGIERSAKGAMVARERVTAVPEMQTPPGPLETFKDSKPVPFNPLPDPWRLPSNYRHHKTFRWAHPRRENVNVMCLFLILCGLAGWLPMSYWLSKLRSDENAAASGFTVNLLLISPLNWLARQWGSMASSTFFPSWVHQKIIRWFCTWHGITDAEAGDIDSYDTVQQFFTRGLSYDPLAEVRSGDHRPDSILAVSPCEGALVAVGPLVDGPSGGKLGVIKGAEYSIGNIAGSAFADFAQEERLKTTGEGRRRYYFVFDLRAKDCHRFVSPINSFVIDRVVQVPGALYPVTPDAFRWMPTLLVENERVAVVGNYVPRTTTDTSRGANGGTASADSSSHLMAVVPIGSPHAGCVRLGFDGRVCTNLAYRPNFNITYKYGDMGGKDVRPRFDMGNELGWFEHGSAIVVVADVPAGYEPCVEAKQVLRAGSPIIKRTLPRRSDEGSTQ